MGYSGRAPGMPAREHPRAFLGGALHTSTPTYEETEYRSYQHESESNSLCSSPFVVRHALFQARVGEWLYPLTSRYV